MKLFSQNPDFYPTPERVIAQMMIGEDILGKRVLEPSAGSGNIVRWLKRNGAQDVIACEKDPHLRKLLDGQCRLIAEDFLQVSADEVSHVDYIVMNPPFSRGAEHILHAYEIAPDNCTIIALCNTSNLSGRSYSRTNNVLAETVKLHGSREDLGCCFEDDAERTTRVEVSLLKLYKQGSGDSEFADYFFSAYDEDDLSGSGKEGLMSYNFVRDIVNRYVSAVKLFDSVLAASKEINDLADFYDYKTVTDPHTGEQKQERNSYGSVPVRFGAIVVKDDERLASEGTAITHDQYKKALQKHYWKIIFSKLHMEKYATAQLRDQINKFVEQQTNVPFTMKNIYRVIDIVIQTNGQRMQRALTEAFDTICSFSAENSTAGETWKTNANYMVNRKFISARSLDATTTRSDLCESTSTIIKTRSISDSGSNGDSSAARDSRRELCSSSSSTKMSGTSSTTSAHVFAVGIFQRRHRRLAGQRRQHDQQDAGNPDKRISLHAVL